MPERLLAGLGQGGEKKPPSFVAVKVVFAADPAIHDVIDRPAIFQTQLARQAATLAHPASTVNSRVQKVRTDTEMHLHETLRPI